jgi:hypothetical protein
MSMCVMMDDDIPTSLIRIQVLKCTICQIKVESVTLAVRQWSETKYMCDEAEAASLPC